MTGGTQVSDLSHEELLSIKTGTGKEQAEGCAHGGVHLRHSMLGAPPIQGSRHPVGTSGPPAGPRDSEGEITEVLDLGFPFPWAHVSYYLLSTHNVRPLCQKHPIESEDPCLVADEAQAWEELAIRARI